MDFIIYYSSGVDSGKRRGSEGVSFPPPKIPKFCQGRAKFPFAWITHPKQLNKNTSFTHLQPLNRGLPPPDPRSLCSLSPTEFVELPQEKIAGHATGSRRTGVYLNTSFRLPEAIAGWTHVT
jgi:hypothetical protein